MNESNAANFGGGRMLDVLVDNVTPIRIKVYEAQNHP